MRLNIYSLRMMFIFFNKIGMFLEGEINVLKRNSIKLIVKTFFPAL